MQFDAANTEEKIKALDRQDINHKVKAVFYHIIFSSISFQ